MRLRTTKTKNGRLFYVIKTYYDSNGKEHSLTVEKLGNENAIREQYNCDPDVWAKAHVAELNEKEKSENQNIQISLSPKNKISKNHRYKFNIGYLFLQSLYYQLGIDKICREIKNKYQFDYDLNFILSRLIYSRILQPCSKSASFRYSSELLEQPNFSEHQIYRALDVLADKSDYIQERLYQNSFVFGKRKDGVIYYDCTNFFFEIEESDNDGLRQYGKSKENRPLPIVEMGMFIDHDGIPMAMCIHPGNTNEQVTLKPLEQKIISNFRKSKFIVCTDAGLASKANRRFNSIQDRAFIVTQSIKKLKADIKEEALKRDGWSRYGRNPKIKHSIDNLDPSNKEDYEATFYKEIWLDQGSFEEKMIVTYSLKYHEYQRNIRNAQIDRAKEAISQGKAKTCKKNQNDYMRFISKITATENGEIATKEEYTLDEKKVRNEEKYDGYYAVVTNLDDDATEIIKVNQRRWKIEECFRILKTEFKSRPVYLQNDKRIKAHFIVCFLALVVYRYLEKILGQKYTCEEIIHTLRDMEVTEILGEGYIPIYTRNEITDNLHEIFGFHTDYQILKKSQMKKILNITKLKTRHAKK